MENEVGFRIFGRNESRRAFDEADRDLARFQRGVDGRLRDMRGRFAAEGQAAGRGFGDGITGGGGRGLGKLAGAVVGLAGKFAGLLAPMAQSALGLAAVGTTAVAAAPLVASAGMAVAEVGSAALSAAPALLALGIAGKLVKVSLTAIFAEGTAAYKALGPLRDGLKKATEAGSEAAAKGIQPLAEGLRKVAQPVVTKFMTGIGEAANKVQREFLGWAKSTDGVKTLKGILEPISGAMKRLAPDIGEAAIAFTRMLGRIMGVSVAAGESGLSGILDKLTDKFNSIDADSVQGGFDKLGKTWDTLTKIGSTLVDWIDTVVQAYKTYTTEFRAVADAVSVAAIIFGGPVVAAIGAIGLIIRHFDEFKAAYEKVKAAFSGGGDGVLGGFMDNLRAAADEVLPSLKNAFEQIKEAVLPVLREIGDKLKNDVIPAFGEFIEAVSPVVSWLVDTLGPVVADTFKAVLEAISGAIDIIVGIFEVFTGVLTGDWSKAWDGVVKIAKGLGKILGAAIRLTVRATKAAFEAVIDILKAIMEKAVDAVVDAAKALGRGVAKVVRAGWGAIKNALEWIKDKTVSMFSNAANWLVGGGRRLISGLGGAIRGAASRATSAMSSIKNKITGAFRNAGSWLVNAGRRIVSGVVSGIRSAGGAIMNAVRGLIPDSIEGLIPGFAHGGIIGAASGGPRGGMVLVGEQGPELVKLAPGSSVTGAGRTRAMLEGGGRGDAPPPVLIIDSAGSKVDDLMVWLLSKAVRDRGGDVQLVLGKG